MITCPNCNHQNPDGALQCEACYTPLPALVACPKCNTPVQADASFCGQCGNDLRNLAAGSAPAETSSAKTSSAETSGAAATASELASAAVSGADLPDSELKTQNFSVPEPSVGASVGGAMSGSDFDVPELVTPDPLIEVEPIGNSGLGASAEEGGSEVASTPIAQPASEPAEAASQPAAVPSAPSAVSVSTPANATQLQVVSARILHVQTDTPIEIPRQLSVVRIGKPNDQTPPDIDVSGFPDSEVVSRVHANLRVEGDVYYLEDVGSSNGTYINGLPLPTGNRHRLRPGDRIALGKGDKVSFIFESA
ncbi:MAG: FHA domain-containing protein [Cyanobacteria bacterium J06635_11]